jgi:hypothetical protein
VLLAAVVFAASGCVAVVAAGAGVGSAAYVMGDLEASEPKSIDVVYAATEKAMESLELRVTSKRKDALSATVVARDSADKKVKVKLAATPEGTTKISIRVGTFGSQTKSMLIYDKIKANLK